MEHLYIRKPFIDYKLYSTDRGLIETDFETMLKSIASYYYSDEIIDIHCNMLPLDEIMEINNSALIYPINTNAPFLYRPIPIDMIKPNQITICYGSSTEQISFAHQIAFIFNSHIIRMGISW